MKNKPILTYALKEGKEDQLAVEIMVGKKKYGGYIPRLMQK